MSQLATGLPDGWTIVKLGEVLRLVNGYGFKESQWSARGLPIIRIQNLKSAQAAFNHFAGELPSKYKARRGDLLFAWSGTPGTSFGAHIWNGGEAWINQHIFRVEYSDTLFDRDFLRLALEINVSAYIEQAQGGVGLAHITKAKLENSRLFVPPLAEQREIARIVERIEGKKVEARSYLDGARRSLARLRRALLVGACTGRLTADWRDQHPGIHPVDLDMARQRRQMQMGRRFREPQPNSHVDFTALPQSWGVGPLGLLLTEIKYGTSQRSEYGASGIPVLRIPNISRERLDIGDLKFATLDAGEAESLSLRLGDLLMIRSNGSVQLVGKTLPVTEEAVGMAYAGYLMRLRTEGEILDPEFLAVTLASPQLRRQIEMPARSTSGVNNINTQEVRGLMVPVPPLDEQREIVRHTSELLHVVNILLGRIEAASRRVDRSSQAVLAKAFRGELLVDAGVPTVSKDANGRP